jgi:hypothetical protein
MTTLTKNKIKLDVCEITENFITVCGSSTSFANIQLAQPIDLLNIKSKIKELSRIAKIKNCKVKGKNKALSFIKINSDSYIELYDSYLKLYNHHKSLIEAKVEKGIYLPTCDDAELNEIYAIRNKISTMWYRSSLLSRMRELNHRVIDFAERLNDENSSLTMVNIG